MKPKIKARLNWVKLYEETKIAGIVCRRCGISRPTLRKWFRSYQELGIGGLKDRGRCLHNCLGKKLTTGSERKILELRQKRKLGTRRIQCELLRNYE